MRKPPPSQNHQISVGRLARVIPIMAAALVGTNCDSLTSPLERDHDAVPDEEIISLSRARTGDLPASFAATDTLVARIPAGAAKRLVTFKTTAGQFVESASKEITVRAVLELSSGKLAARTLLRADTIAATAIVRATIADQFYDTLSIRFVKP